MDVGPFIAIAAITIVTLAGNRLLPDRRKRRRRALTALPYAEIAAAQGAVRIIGWIRQEGELLEAPLSGRPCIGYTVVILSPWQASGPDGGTQGWQRLVDLQQACRFLVEDEHGTARVDTSGPYVLALEPDVTGATNGQYPGNYPAVASLLESSGIDATNWLGRWRAVRFEECILAPGALVTVGGDSVEEVDPQGERAGLRSPPKRLVLRGSAERPLLIAKESLDGKG